MAACERMPLATKVFNRKKWLSLWAPTALSLRMFPPSSTQMTSRAASAVIYPKNKPFLAKTLRRKSSGGATKAGIGKADCSCPLAMAVLLIDYNM